MKRGLLAAGIATGVADLFLETYRAFNDRRIVDETRPAGNAPPTPLDRFAIDTLAPAFRG
jgi:hypothetical protein